MREHHKESRALGVAVQTGDFTLARRFSLSGSMGSIQGTARD